MRVECSPGYRTPSSPHAAGTALRTLSPPRQAFAVVGAAVRDSPAFVMGFADAPHEVPARLPSRPSRLPPCCPFVSPKRTAGCSFFARPVPA